MSDCDVKDNIYHFKNMISEEECKYLIDAIDKYKENGQNLDHSKYNNNVKSHVITTDDIDEHYTKYKCHQIITDTLKKVIFKSPESLCVIKIANYMDNIELRKIWGDTKRHIDGMISDPHLDSSKHLRVLSIIVALNSDYDGGELCFPGQDFKIKLKAGEVLAFPPYWTHPHYSNELKNDTYRYTITTWFCE